MTVSILIFNIFLCKCKLNSVLLQFLSNFNLAPLSAFSGSSSIPASIFLFTYTTERQVYELEPRSGNKQENPNPTTKRDFLRQIGDFISAVSFLNTLAFEPSVSLLITAATSIAKNLMTP